MCMTIYLSLISRYSCETINTWIHMKIDIFISCSNLLINIWLESKVSVISESSRRCMFVLKLPFSTQILLVFIKIISQCEAQTHNLQITRLTLCLLCQHGLSAQWSMLGPEPTGGEESNFNRLLKYVHSTCCNPSQQRGLQTLLLFGCQPVCPGFYVIINTFSIHISIH